MCSCVQLIVHSDCLVYNNTKPLLPHFTLPVPSPPSTNPTSSLVFWGIASRFQNLASRGEVAPLKRVAISIRSQLHACCQVDTRCDANLVEMHRKVLCTLDIRTNRLRLSARPNAAESRGLVPSGWLLAYKRNGQSPTSKRSST
jgi:hypothetical protein